MGEHSGISMRAADWRIDQKDAVWEWLRRALHDVGHPVAGWGRTYQSAGHRRSFCMRGPAQPVVDAIRSLWANERPGCALDIRVEYDADAAAVHR